MGSPLETFCGKRGNSWKAQIFGHILQRGSTASSVCVVPRLCTHLPLSAELIVFFTGLLSSSSESVCTDASVLVLALSLSSSSFDESDSKRESAPELSERDPDSKGSHFSSSPPSRRHSWSSDCICISCDDSWGNAFVNAAHGEVCLSAAVLFTALFPSSPPS